MGNKITHSDALFHPQLELDCRERIYFNDQIISGRLRWKKPSRASVVLIGTASFAKQRRKRIDVCSIEFYRNEFLFDPSTNKDQTFHFHLDPDLPTSSHSTHTLPKVSYSIHLIDRSLKKRRMASLPIHLCPRVQIDQPFRLRPFYFGPIEHPAYRTSLGIKLQRTAFTFQDLIQFSYELRNPKQHIIDDLQISLAIDERVESNISHDEIAHGIHHHAKAFETSAKLIRNKVFINLPQNCYLPPSSLSQHKRNKYEQPFETEINYKIHIKISMNDQEELWQVDVPIILAHELIDND